MTEPGTNDRDDLIENTDVVVDDEPERVDLGNHEDEDFVEPPHINDAGEKVDADGNKVFTTNEEALKDGSMVLDRKGRQPGVYLDDIEEELADRHRQRVQEAFDKSTEGTHTVVERQVNVVNSPLPPVTTRTVQEHPLTQDTADDLDDEPVVDESESEKVG